MEVAVQLLGCDSTQPAHGTPASSLPEPAQVLTLLLPEPLCFSNHAHILAAGLRAASSASSKPQPHEAVSGCNGPAAAVTVADATVAELAKQVVSVTYSQRAASQKARTMLVLAYEAAAARACSSSSSTVATHQSKPQQLTSV